MSLSKIAARAAGLCPRRAPPRLAGFRGLLQQAPRDHRSGDLARPRGRSRAGEGGARQGRGRTRLRQDLARQDAVPRAHEGLRRRMARGQEGRHHERAEMAAIPEGLQRAAQGQGDLTATGFGDVTSSASRAVGVTRRATGPSRRRPRPRPRCRRARAPSRPGGSRASRRVGGHRRSGCRTTIAAGPRPPPAPRARHARRGRRRCRGGGGPALT